MKRVVVTLSALVAVALMIGAEIVRLAPSPEGRLQVQVTLPPDDVSVSVSGRALTLKFEI
ncbi:MAG: hypothetical protein K2P58_01040 [Hyphomonadaceae bacterium]|nr:hypothetical protein [Hyphomonadaceae bacterium]